MDLKPWLSKIICQLEDHIVASRTSHQQATSNGNTTAEPTLTTSFATGTNAQESQGKARINQSNTNQSVKNQLDCKLGADSNDNVVRTPDVPDVSSNSNFLTWLAQSLVKSNADDETKVNQTGQPNVNIKNSANVNHDVGDTTGNVAKSLANNLANTSQQSPKAEILHEPIRLNPNQPVIDDKSAQKSAVIDSSWRKPKQANQVVTDDSSAPKNIVTDDKKVTEKKPQPPKDGDKFKVTGLVLRDNYGRFSAIIEGGLYANRSLTFSTKNLPDESVPVIPKKTRVELNLKLQKVPNTDDKFIVMYASVQGYTDIASCDVCKAFDSLSNDTHEELIKKLSLTWKPLFEALLKNADKFDQNTIVLVLSKIIPQDSESRSNKNKPHQKRFQNVIELFASKDSTFLLRLGQLNVFDHHLVKRLTEYVTLFTKKLDPVCSLLDGYYNDDAKGLIELIKTCCKVGFDPTAALATQNFRDVPLIPVSAELTGVITKLISNSDDITEKALLQLESHLIPNCIHGPWGSPEEFLNVHFRLLREECFASIRDRIASVRVDPANKNVHREVKVVGYAVADGTIIARLKYKAHSSRANLMFGNLLCLDVNTNFSNPIWATVQNSDTKNSIIAISLVGVGNSYADTESNDSLLSADILVTALMRLISCQSGVMVESPTYYHAFRPVLARLQSLEEEEFPFCSEILLKSIHLKRTPIRFDRNIDTSKMDDSQAAAVDTALKARFSLIQGPPGCGKTFIGKIIIKTMLRSEDRTGPILLLSYKNHALDSMLEGCLEFTKSLVRIGGKSSSEAIEPYNLHNLRKEAKVHFSTEEFRNLQDAKNKLTDLQNDLQREAAVFLSEFTALALFRFLKQTDVGTQQLFSLLLVNFAKNYSDIIKQKVSYSSEAEVRAAAAEIVVNEPKLAEKLLKLSLEQWLSESEVGKFLPNPQGSLFVKQPTAKKSKKAKKDDDDEIMEEDELDQVFAERQVGPESKYEFVSISTKGQKLYPKLQDRFLDLDVDSRVKDFAEIDNVWHLSPEGRYLLLSHWLREWHKDKDEHFAINLDSYRKFQEQVKQLEDEKTINFLKTRDVVACTITGCCLRMSMLSRVAPSVVIVEEAAEILESQLIAALPTGVQHVVLIGDHKQLPPQVSHYRLRIKYKLGVSIFERLADNGFPVSQLRYHRRGPQSLCPLFSRFYTNHIVPTKQDPLSFPGVLKKLGLMYWWTHDAPARKPPSGTSFENEFEAAMVVGTARFLIWQGDVKPAQIGIICGYLGQAKIIKELFKTLHIEGVTVNTVDRFQGDENDYIFLSLVRSSTEDTEDGKKPTLGFLGSDNRACVALSRARLGLYIFGNSDLFGSTPPWKTTVNYFKSKGKLGRELHFVHSGNMVMFEHPNDYKMFFKKVELEKKEMKIHLQNKFLKDIPAHFKEGIHDVTKEFGIKIEKLMNDTVFDKKDLGQGRDAHGQRFSYFKVVSVKRIFNKDMYLPYMILLDGIKKKKPPKLKVDSMPSWLQKEVDSEANEVFLFHGTDEYTAYKLILKSGFDERVSKMTNLFGPGVYFAENADKSDQYSKAAPHIMFLARVILGRPFPTLRCGTWRRPPAIDEARPVELYDSIMGLSKRKTKDKTCFLERHQEFIVYDRNQCLPEFLIEYKRQ